MGYFGSVQVRFGQSRGSFWVVWETPVVFAEPHGGLTVPFVVFCGSVAHGQFFDPSTAYVVYG